MFATKKTDYRKVTIVECHNCKMNTVSHCVLTFEILFYFPNQLLIRLFDLT